MSRLDAAASRLIPVDIDQTRVLRPTVKLAVRATTPLSLSLFASGWQKMKTPIGKPAPIKKPLGARKPPRIMEEIRKVIEEYASTQREFLKALRKRLFH